jgi:hypothetical protein
MAISDKTAARGRGMSIGLCVLKGVAILGVVLVGAFIAQLGPLHGDVIHVLVLAASSLSSGGWRDRNCPELIERLSVCPLRS